MNPTPPPPHAPPQARPTSAQGTTRGFTLMELLVVITIIGILMSITVAGGVLLRQSSQVAETRMAIHGLKGIATEYQTIAGAPVNHELPGAIDWTTPKARNAPRAEAEQGGLGAAVITGSDPDGLARPQVIEASLSIKRFLWAALQISDTADMVMGLPDAYLLDLDSDGFYEVIDPWGMPLLYSDVGLLPDPDVANNTLTTPRASFRSAGPDREFFTDDDITSEELE